MISVSFVVLAIYMHCIFTVGNLGKQKTERNYLDELFESIIINNCKILTVNLIADFVFIKYQ